MGTTRQQRKDLWKQMVLVAGHQTPDVFGMLNVLGYELMQSSGIKQYFRLDTSPDGFSVSVLFLVS